MPNTLAQLLKRFSRPGYAYYRAEPRAGRPRPFTLETRERNLPTPLEPNARIVAGQPLQDRALQTRYKLRDIGEQFITGEEQSLDELLYRPQAEPPKNLSEFVSQSAPLSAGELPKDILEAFPWTGEIKEEISLATRSMAPSRLKQFVQQIDQDLQERPERTPLEAFQDAYTPYRSGRPVNEEARWTAGEQRGLPAQSVGAPERAKLYQAEHGDPAMDVRNTVEEVGLAVEDLPDAASRRVTREDIDRAQFEESRALTGKPVPPKRSLGDLLRYTELIEKDAAGKPVRVMATEHPTLALSGSPLAARLAMMTEGAPGQAVHVTPGKSLARLLDADVAAGAGLEAIGKGVGAVPSPNAKASPHAYALKRMLETINPDPETSVKAAVTSISPYGDELLNALNPVIGNALKKDRRAGFKPPRALPTVKPAAQVPLRPSIGDVVPQGRIVKRTDFTETVGQTTNPADRYFGEASRTPDFEGGRPRALDEDARLRDELREAERAATGKLRAPSDAPQDASAIVRQEPIASPHWRPARGVTFVPEGDRWRVVQNGTPTERTVSNVKEAVRDGLLHPGGEPLYFQSKGQYKFIGLDPINLSVRYVDQASGKAFEAPFHEALASGLLTEQPTQVAIKLAKLGPVTRKLGLALAVGGASAAALGGTEEAEAANPVAEILKRARTINVKDVDLGSPYATTGAQVRRAPREAVKPLHGGLAFKVHTIDSMAGLKHLGSMAGQYGKEFVDSIQGLGGVLGNSRKMLHDMQRTFERLDDIAIDEGGIRSTAGDIAVGLLHLDQGIRAWNTALHQLSVLESKPMLTSAEGDAFRRLTKAIEERKVVAGGMSKEALMADRDALLGKLSPEVKAASLRANKILYDALQEKVQELHGAGILSAETMRYIKAYGPWIPFKREMGEFDADSLTIKDYLSMAPGGWDPGAPKLDIGDSAVIMRMFGSERIGQNPFRSAAEAIVQADQELFRNRITKEFAEKVVPNIDNPLAKARFAVSEKPFLGLDVEFGQLTYMQDGKARYIKVPRIVDEMFQLAHIDRSTAFPKALSGMMAMLSGPYRKMLTVWSAGFATTQGLSKDPMAGYLFGVLPDAYKQGRSVESALTFGWQWLRAIGNLYKDAYKDEIGPLQNKLYKSGAGMSGYSVLGTDLDRMLSPRQRGRLGFRSSLGDTLNRFMTQPMENATKIATMETLESLGITGAEQMSKVRRLGGSPDFMQSGASMQPYNQAFVFLNPQIQGIVRQLETYRQDPTMLGVHLAIATGLAMAEYAWNSDKKDPQTGFPSMWELNGPVRDGNLAFFGDATNETSTGRIARKPFLIPLAPEVQLLLNPLRKLVAAAQGDPTISPLQAITDFATAFLPGSASPLDVQHGPGEFAESVAMKGISSMIPGLKLPLEQLMNKDAFSGNAIDSRAMQGLPPEDRYTGATSPVAVGIGQATKLSPERIEHVLRGAFPGVGESVLGTVDAYLKEPGAEQSGWEQATRGNPLAPVLRRFLGPAHSATHQARLKDLYAAADASSKATRGMNVAAEKGDMPRVRELAPQAAENRGNLEFTRAFSDLRKQRQALLRAKPPNLKALLQAITEQEFALSRRFDELKRAQ